MMQPITLLLAGLFFVVLYLRYRNRKKQGQTRKRRRPFMLAKVILVALLAWLIISYILQSLLDKMGGEDHQPSFMERVVSSLSSHTSS
jgi:preprotein translocase subunit SecG